MIAHAILSAAMAVQTAPAAGSFAPSEVRTMCRGETDEPHQFRTEAAFQLLAQHQRSKCRMYLLGLADGLARSMSAGARAACLPPAAERNDLGDRLVEAVLRDAGGGDVAAVVRRVLQSRYDCR